MINTIDEALKSPIKTIETDGSKVSFHNADDLLKLKRHNQRNRGPLQPLQIKTRGRYEER